jgi:hypothetical protein
MFVLNNTLLNSHVGSKCMNTYTMKASYYIVIINSSY